MADEKHPVVQNKNGTISCYVATFADIVDDIADLLVPIHREENILQGWRTGAKEFVKDLNSHIALKTQFRQKQYLVYAEVEYTMLRKVLESLHVQTGAGREFRVPSQLPRITTRDIECYLDDRQYPTKPKFSLVMLVSSLRIIRHLMFPKARRGPMIDRMGHHLRAASCLTEPEERNVFLELEYAAVKDWNVVARTPTALKDQLLLLFDVQCLRRILELRHPSEGKALDFVKQVVKENRRYAESLQTSVERDPNQVSMQPESEQVPKPEPFFEYLGGCLLRHPLPRRPAARPSSSSSAAKRTRSSDDPQVESSGTQSAKRYEGSATRSIGPEPSTATVNESETREAPHPSQPSERSLAHFLSDRKRRLYGF
ncbi:hypothetical protein JCM16303_001197 [Sporobolomyces ruberrimus]